MEAVVVVEVATMVGVVVVTMEEVEDTLEVSVLLHMQGFWWMPIFLGGGGGHQGSPGPAAGWGKNFQGGGGGFIFFHKFYFSFLTKIQQEWIDHSITAMKMFKFNIVF